jgi:hypothetical protein
MAMHAQNACPDRDLFFSTPKGSEGVASPIFALEIQQKIWLEGGFRGMKIPIQ